MGNSNGKEAVILLAEDNPADQEITRRTLSRLRVRNELNIVADGVELMEYLRGEGKHKGKDINCRPDILLLDINMPRLNGKDALKIIKSDPDLKTIPVVMLTTSGYERDIEESYQLGANAYITKPADVKQFIDVLEKLKNFWLMVVTLPSKDKNNKEDGGHEANN